MENYNILKNMVSTKYKDMEGLVSLDALFKPDLYDLCNDNGIDMEQYYLLGFGIGDVSLVNLKDHSNVFCTVLLLEKSKYGNSFDDISSRIRNEKQVDVIKKSFSVEYACLGKCLKRFDLMALTDMGDYISSMNIIE